MPRATLLLFFSVLAWGIWLLTATVGAQTPTPAGSPSPTASVVATPTPYGGPVSTIAIRFLQNGQPTTVNLAAPLHRLVADGVVCPVAIPQAAGPYSGYSIQWPLVQIPEMPTECRKGPPTTLRFEFNSNFGILSSEFVWSGSDVTANIEIPGPTTPSNLASPSPASPTVRGLPGTGGGPLEPSSRPAWVLSIVAGSLALLGLLAMRRLEG